MRILIVLLFITLFSHGIFFSREGFAFDLSYENAQVFLESITKHKLQDKEVALRWVKPIYVYWDLKGDAILEQHVRELFTRLNKEVNNLTVIVTPIKSISNFTIELAKGAEFLEKAKAANIELNAEDICGVYSKGRDAKQENVTILVRDNGRRQSEVHCTARMIMNGLGVGDPQGDGVLLINSVLQPYDTNILSLSSLDITIANFAYAKEGRDKAKYVAKFQKEAINNYIFEHKIKIKSSLNNLMTSSINRVDTPNYINSIEKINNKIISFSYFSYFPNLFLYDDFGLDFSPLTIDFLSEVKNFCRICFFTLLRTKVNKASFAMQATEAGIFIEYFNQAYNPRIDSPLIKARVHFNKAHSNFKSKEAGGELQEAEKIHRMYFGENSSQVAWLRHAIARWYFFQGDYKSAATEVLKNQNLLNGTIFDPVSEAMQLIDGAILLKSAGLVPQAQIYTNKAFEKLNPIKSMSRMARQELGRLEYIKKEYKIE